MNTRIPRCVQAALLVLALIDPVNLRAQSLALTPADSGTSGQADPGGGWGIHIPTLSFVFQVNAPIEVTALGYYFITTNPLGQLDVSGPDQNYNLTLHHWNGASLDSTLAATTVNGVSAWSNSSLNHNFSYNNVTPVTLTPGNTYVISATGADVGDFFYQTTNYTIGTEIIFYETLNASNTPTGLTNGNYNIFGPNLFYTSAIPEPAAAAMWLGVVGFALAAIFRRRPQAVT